MQSQSLLAGTIVGTGRLAEVGNPKHHVTSFALTGLSEQIHCGDLHTLTSGLRCPTRAHSIVKVIGKALQLARWKTDEGVFLLHGAVTAVGQSGGKGEVL